MTRIPDTAAQAWSDARAGEKGGDEAGRLKALLERVEAATGPDRELDLALAQVLVPDVIVLRQRDNDSGADPYTHWTYTASIDAALALVERCLPGCAFRLQRNLGGRPWCEFQRYAPDHNPPSHPSFDVWNEGGFQATPPLAILAALLRALISQREPAS